jgi:acyl carrier protein
LPADERAQVLLDVVCSNTATVLGHPDAREIEPHRGFLESGLDSLTAVELRNRLGGVTGLALPATVIFDYPTPVALAGYLGELADPGEPDPSRPVLAELDRLAAVLGAATGVAADTRAVIGRRLHELLAGWEGDATPETGPGDVAGRLQAASADELFDFIQREFGKS